MKRKLLSVVLALALTALLAVGLSSCNLPGSSSDNGIAGTYYYYVNGNYTSQYIELKDDYTAVASNGKVSYNGTYQLDGINITITFDMQDDGANSDTPSDTAPTPGDTKSAAGVLSGTVSDGVMTLTLDGEKAYFCKKGKTPQTQTSPGNDDKNIDGATYGYFREDASFKLMQCDRDTVNLVIPSEIDGIPVTGLLTGALQGCHSLESVEIPASITRLFDYENPFETCRSLKSITVSEDNPSFSSEGGILYNKDKTELLYAPIGLSGSVVLPESVTSISDGAFRGNTALTKVTLGSKITSIGTTAFTECTALTEINLPDGLIYIGDSAFAGCTSLKYNEYEDADYLGNDQNPYLLLVQFTERGDTCTIHKDTVFCDEYAFTEFGGIRYASVPVSFIDRLPKENIVFLTVSGGGVLESIEGFPALKELIVSESVEGIEFNCIADCDNIESLTVPFLIKNDSEYNIGSVKNIFADYDGTSVPSSLKNVTVLGGELVPDFSFSGLSGLQSIVLPDTVTEIGFMAFNNCTSLTSIDLPDNLACLGDFAFSECNSLPVSQYDNALYIGEKDNAYSILKCAVNKDITSCTIHEDTKIIYSEAFFECKNLKNVSVPSGVQIMGGYSFKKSGVTDVYIPEGVSYIGMEAFYLCSSLVNVSLPDSISLTGKDAFWGCDSLKLNKYDNGYYIGNATTPYVALLKTEDVSITSCNIATGTRLILEGTFSHCYMLTHLSIPENVTYIAQNAFFENKKLVEICNLSSLDIQPGSKDNGRVALYALNVYTQGETSYLVKENDYTYYIDGDTVILLGYSGSETDLVLPENVNGKPYSIGAYAFADCNSIVSIYVPSAVTGIDRYALYNNISVASISVSPDNAYYTAVDGILYNKDTTEFVIIPPCIGGNVSVPEGITDIPSSAFQGRTALTDIYLPDGLKIIRTNAFDNCNNLSVISIPQSIELISSWAFSRIGADTITYRGTVEQWNAVEKANGWDEYLTAQSVVCTDGIVAL